MKKELHEQSIVTDVQDENNVILFVLLSYHIYSN